MSYAKFLVAVKSTLDREINLLAASRKVGYFDLDTAFMDEQFLQSKKPGLGWSFSTLDPAPLDPMYKCEFQVCGKSSLDPAEYERLDLVGELLSYFDTGRVIPVLDYSSTATPTATLGSIQIEGINVLPNQYERTAGFRFLRVHTNIVRWA